MPEIKFDTGLVTYDLNSGNGKVQVSFNPTDSHFVEKLLAATDALDKEQEAHESDTNSAAPEALFDKARERDRTMRGLLDNTFGAPVCEALFGGMNLYAMADGLPVWCNLVLAVMDEVAAASEREMQKMDPRLAKYTAKYKRRK